MQSNNKRILELDALRGIAALSVFFYHASIYYKESFYFSIFRFGLTGVDLFFIISGFVILSSIQNKTHLQFIKSRLIRLFPTYWIAVTFTFIFIIIKYFDKGILNQIPIKQYLVNLSMIQEFFKIENLDGPYWTLYIELFFYLIVFIFIKKEKLIFVILSLIIIITLILRFDVFYVPFPISILNSTPISSHASLFLIGMLFYKLRDSMNSMYLIPILIFFATQILIYKYHYTWIKNTDINFNEHLIMVLLYFLIFLLFVYNKLSFLVNNIFIFFGKISYTLYLIHQYVTTEIIEYYLVNKMNFNLGVVIFMIILPIIIITSFYLTKVTDKISSFLTKRL